MAINAKHGGDMQTALLKIQYGVMVYLGKLVAMGYWEEEVGKRGYMERCYNIHSKKCGVVLCNFAQKGCLHV